MPYLPAMLVVDLRDPLEPEALRARQEPKVHQARLVRRDRQAQMVTKE